MPNYVRAGKVDPNGGPVHMDGLAWRALASAHNAKIDAYYVAEEDYKRSAIPEFDRRVTERERQEGIEKAELFMEFYVMFLAMRSPSFAKGPKTSSANEARGITSLVPETALGLGSRLRVPKASVSVPERFTTSEITPMNSQSTILSRSTTPGNYTYGVSESGQVRVVPDLTGGHVHPSIFGGGQAVLAAGEVTIGAGGVVTKLNNISGSFLPTPESLFTASRMMQIQGMKIAPGAVQPYIYAPESLPLVRPKADWMDKIKVPTEAP